MNLHTILATRSRLVLVVLVLTLVMLVGWLDYVTGYELNVSTLYLLPVALATWYLGMWFGSAISLLSVLVALFTDVATGEHFRSSLIPIWNSSILLVFYLVVVWLACKLRVFNRELEDRVQQRTAALSSEIVERRRLEKEILEISERERRSIGHELHDSLGQHLTGTAFAGQVLEEKLIAKAQTEAGDARRIVLLIEEGIELTRQLARGLHPVEMQADGLVNSLQALTVVTTERFAVDCRFSGEPDVLIRDATTAAQLYRIVQEALSNSIRHGKAKRILVSLTPVETGIRLTIEDDGVGIPKRLPLSNGMGLRIMEHRAKMLGGVFAIERLESGGTMVRCLVPK